MRAFTYLGAVLCGWTVILPSAAAAPMTLSLSEAVAMARQNAPDVRMAEGMLHQAQARRVGAGVIMPVNPRVYAEARPAITGSPWELGYAANMENQFEVFGAPAARVREAQQYAKMADAGLQLERYNTQYRTCQLYIELQLGQQLLLELEQMLVQARRVLHASEHRLQQGAGSDIDVAAAKLELSELVLAQQHETAQQTNLQMQLRQLLNLAPTQAIILSTPVQSAPATIARTDAMQQALIQRPELTVIRERLLALAARRNTLKAEIRPKVGIFTGVDQAPLSPAFGQLGVSIELPVARRNATDLAIVSATETYEEKHLQLELERIERDLTVAQEKLKVYREQLVTLDEDALPAAQHAMTLVESGWLAGRFDIFRVVNAARNLTRLRTLKLHILGTAWKERIALAHAMGIQDPSGVVP